MMRYIIRDMNVWK